jgi:hypothetical protein
MPTLSKELRRTLENVVADARRIAETGAEQALKQLAVHHSESWPAMTTEEKALREKLRAHGKQLGDKREPNRTQEIPRLKQACAYEHWHRMLFARFLAENNLLIHPDYGEPISLGEVRELAREQNADWLSIAASFAQKMLLEVFRPDDPVLDLILPPETRQKLEDKLAVLPTEVFTAEDSLGWVYQFWQRDEKDAVNKSEVKIGADEISPVTQLFTEDYMVLYLLHNTLGAWWTAQRRSDGRNCELPGCEWTYLRFNEDGSPAAGNFDAWPKTTREIRVLDPCMGSGHFLTFALPILARMRQAEEGMNLSDAVCAVLADNLYGLELDARCSQIAAFNLALTAWKLAGSAIALPSLNLACTGIGIHASEESWTALAGDGRNLRFTLQQSYKSFQKAPVLGSLIDPNIERRAFLEFDQIWPLLQTALSTEQSNQESRELVIAAKGILDAARMLIQQYTLVTTNVPFLLRRKQNQVLLDYGDTFPSAKSDLATLMVSRCSRLLGPGGALAVVTPQNWLYLGTYEQLRRELLKKLTWHLIAWLGPGAFAEITGEVVKPVLLVVTNGTSERTSSIGVIDVSKAGLISEKVSALKAAPLTWSLQTSVISGPQSRLSIGGGGEGELLESVAQSINGMTTGDLQRLSANFWEIPRISDSWTPLQTTPEASEPVSGCNGILRWRNGGGIPEALPGSFLRGIPVWGRLGIIVRQTGILRASLYFGVAFEVSTAVLIPNDEKDLPAIWAYVSSPTYNSDVRAIDPSLKVTNATLAKVLFNLAEWADVVRDTNRDTLPPIITDDPTQWIFNGHPMGSKKPLQVAVARLLGYRWPRQTGSTFLSSPTIEPDLFESHADADGIVCLSSMSGRPPAAERLRALLADAYGLEWSAAELSKLIGDASSLEIWLRDRFFEEHCEIFHNRPFIWHIWDGRKDGFHALVNYHKLAGDGGEGRRTLEKLIYTLLGDWISRQQAEVESGAEGAEARLVAAEHLRSELISILDGKTPHDIFVRWKPIHLQPVGWEPDLNDGIRLNIRPWLTAQPHKPTRRESSILRVTPKITYGKDRGREPARDKTEFPWLAGSTDRNNDIHLSIEEKLRARERRKK